MHSAPKQLVVVPSQEIYPLRNTESVALFNPDGSPFTASSGEGGGGAVSSVNGSTGDVVLDAEAVGAQPASENLDTILSVLENLSINVLAESADTERPEWPGRVTWICTYSPFSQPTDAVIGDAVIDASGT